MKKTWILLTVAMFLAAAAEEFGSVTIEQKPSLTQTVPLGGYLVSEFRISNRDPLQPAQVEIGMTGDYGTPREASRRLLLPPGATVDTTLYWPNSGGRSSFRRPFSFNDGSSLVGGSSDEFRVKVNGKFYENHFRGRDTADAVHFRLCSQELRTNEELMLLFDLTSGGRYSPMAAETSNLPLLQWPLRLRDYAGIQEIWLGIDDPVPSALKVVLDQWVFSGGTLVRLVGPDAPWPQGAPGKENEFHKASFGGGRYIVCRPVGPGKKEILKQGMDSNKGPFHERELNEVGRRLQGTTPLLFEEIKNTTGNSFFNEETAAAALALPIKNTSTRALFVVMLVFVIVIGPVNYLILRRKQRTVYLLVTMPVISLFFCAAVIIYITVAEGWNSSARMLGVTQLDQTTYLATTRALVGVYSPLAYRNALPFTTADRLQFVGNTGQIKLALDQGQIILPGMIRARIPAYFILSRCEPRREQLRIGEMDRNSVALVNGLGGRIETLLLRDRDGNGFRSGEAIEAGARYVLKPGNAGTSLAELIPELQSMLPFENLPPGYYAAVLSEAVFYSPGVAAEDSRARHLVIGKFQ